MYTNHYDVLLHDDEGNIITAALRLPLAAQIELRKKYGKDTRTILFSAATDDDMFLTVLNKCLNWAGNANTIKTGEELFERLVDEGLMGIIERQRIIIEIGAASGVFSDKEKEGLMTKVDSMERAMFSGGDGAEIEEEADEKKA